MKKDIATAPVVMAASLCLSVLLAYLGYRFLLWRQPEIVWDTQKPTWHIITISNATGHPQTVYFPMLGFTGTVFVISNTIDFRFLINN